MAKRRNYSVKDNGAEDPLAEYGNDFSIIQFLAAENETPVDSPADPRGAGPLPPIHPPQPHPPQQQQQQQQQPQQQQQLQQQQHQQPPHPQQQIQQPQIHQQQQIQHQQLQQQGPPHPQQHHPVINNNMGRQQAQQAAVQDPQHNMMYPNPSRLPDSPPITDISGNGSSSSPSSNSDPPYSPENYDYGVPHGHGSLANNNGGVILGVNDLQGGMAHHQNYMINQQPCYPGYNPQPIPDMSQHPQMAQNMQPQYINMQPPYQQQSQLYELLNNSNEGSLNSQASEAPGNSRKRPRHESQDRYMNSGGVPNSLAASPVDTTTFSDENYQQVIKFTRFEENTWCPLFDEQSNQLTQLQTTVVADKGFNFSPSDGCYVNQKKNHFQISVHIEANDPASPKYVSHNGQLKVIERFMLAFCGVKAEMTNSEIEIRQSQTDRKPIKHLPVLLEIAERRMTKVTVPRLHFSETTACNQRKNFKPNPEQKYFLLLMRLLVRTEDQCVALVQAYASERVIVRVAHYKPSEETTNQSFIPKATNPGSFEPPESEVEWKKNGTTMYTMSPVAIGCDTPLADNVKFSVDGNIMTSGAVIKPSDRRLKEGILPKGPREALENLCKLRVVEFLYKPEVAEKWGLTEDQRLRTGLIAQELAEVIPDAVKDIGDYLTVDESRVFYETVLATQELCKLTGDLDCKIDEKVAEISSRLTNFAHRKKMLGSMASNLSGDTQSNVDNKSILSYSRSSLASFTKDRKKSSRSCRSHCTRPEPLCNSKLTQGAIVTLVVVMAACLIAMSALYVLDWQNRNWGFHHSSPPTATPAPRITTSTSESVGHMIDPSDHPYIPMSQPDAPALMSDCFSDNCITYCCPEYVAYQNPYQNSHDDMDDDFQDNLESIMMQEDEDDSEGISRNIVQRSIPELAYPDQLPPGVSISIPMLNATIDHRYCFERNCDRLRNRYTLYIPVTSYLPTMPLQVQFKVPYGKTVNNCGYLADFQFKQCSIIRDKYTIDRHLNPMSFQISDDTFELSVGTYLQSAYRFRVGYTTESCFATEDQQHGAYEEYNLFFYRTCARSRNH